MSISEIVGIAVKLAAFATVFALGLGARGDDVVYLLRRPGLLARSLLAMYVLTPLVAVALLFVFDAPFPVEVAVVLMTISAGAPALPKKLLKVGANTPYVYSLAVITALLAIVTVPASLAVLGAFFGRDVSAPAGDVATVILMGFLAPLAAGMLVRRAWPALADRIDQTLLSISGVIVLVAMLIVVAGNATAIMGLGMTAFALIVTVTLAALAAGHGLGGPDAPDRAALALACATRFPAIGVLVASLEFPGAKPLPLVAAYSLASALVVIPYIRWRRAGR